MAFGGGSKMNLEVVMTAKDNASAKLKGMSGAIGVAKKALLGIGIAAGAAAVGIGVKAVQAAASFESKMADVSTLVDTNVESMDEMRRAVLDLAKDMPISADELATALYQVRSAGISAADAMDVLETSAKLGVAGLGSTEEATNLLTSAINVYGDSTHDANKLANILFKTVKAGKTTIAELSAGFGKVAALAKETGISIEDLSAATAILTTGGITAAEAQTSLKAMISNVLKPTADAEAAAKKLGIEFNLGALKAKGLAGMLKEIAEKAGTDKQVLADLFGSVEAANAIFALTSKEGGAALIKVLEEMGIETDMLDEAFIKQMETVTNLWSLVKDRLNIALIELGSKILPPVSKWLKDNKDRIQELIDKSIEWVEKVAIPWIQEHWPAIKNGIKTVFSWIGKIIVKIAEFVAAHPTFTKAVGAMSAVLLLLSGTRIPQTIKAIASLITKIGFIPSSVIIGIALDAYLIKKVFTEIKALKKDLEGLPKDVRIRIWAEFIQDIGKGLSAPGLAVLRYMGIIRQAGGVVPGALGQPVPITAHGGESIRPSGITAGGGERSIVVNMTINGGINNQADVRKIGQQIGRQIELAQQGMR